MDGGWTGNTLPLGFSFLANHGWYAPLLSFFYLPSKNLLALTYLLAYHASTDLITNNYLFPTSLPIYDPSFKRLGTKMKPDLNSSQVPQQLRVIRGYRRLELESRTRVFLFEFLE
jgi:hypothetical protein